MVTLIDYGLGNIQALARIFGRLNVPFRIAETPADLELADRIILPGVGSFDWAMERLEASGMRPCLDELVLVRQRPVLGICVGMQMMSRRSDEGRSPGLGWIDAEVRRFDGTDGRLPLPHMGWNDVAPLDANTLFRGIESPRFYFLHSYYFSPSSPSCALATTNYSQPFVSAVRAGNIYGVQFHPEKSHQWGLQLLKNFADL